MIVTKKFSFDLDTRGISPLMYAVQGEVNTRKVEISLFSNGTAWEIPDGTVVAVAYCKPDGTNGLYDKLPIGESASAVSGNVVTVMLAPQVLTCAGKVMASIIFYSKDMVNTLATFPFQIYVEKNPGAGEQISNNYYYLQNLDQVNTELQGILVGYDGTIYASAGEAVRSQALQAINAKMAEEEVLADGTVNIVFSADDNTEDANDVTDITNTLTWTEKTQISVGGEMYELENYRYSNIITLNKGKAIKVIASGGNNQMSLISKWSADGNTFISCVHQSSGLRDLETVEHAATETEYLRICYSSYHTVTVNNAQLVVEIYTATVENPDDTPTVTLGDCSQINGRNLVDKEARRIAEQAMVKAEEAIENITESNPTEFENLYSSENNIDGKWVNSGGNIADASNGTVASVAVEGGKDIYLCYNTEVEVTQTTVSSIRFADGDTKISNITDISLYILSGQYMGYPVIKLTVPANATQVEFCVRISPAFDATETMVVSYTDLTIVDTGWTPKVWADKKWAVVGDSLSDPNTEYTTKYYFDYIREHTGITLVNMAKRGTAYAKEDAVGAGNAFYHRIVNVPTDADIVTIFGSFNDYAAGLPIGEIDDTELTTVCGYINATLDRLYEVMPTVQLGIITPTPWDSFNLYQPTAGSDGGVGYVDKLIGICQKRSIPYLDLYRYSNLRPWDATFRQYAYSKDHNGGGTHPDETGNKIIAPRILEFLKTLLMY